MLKCQREKFRLQRKFAYLNCAYMSPLPKKVENAGKKGLFMKRTPWKVGPDHFFKDLDTLRILYSKIIDTDEKERIVTIPSVSYGMANVVHNLNLKEGDKIVIVGEQFPSNVYPWLSLKNKGVHIEIISPPESLDSRGEKWNEKLIQAIDENTRLVAIGNIHWVDGTRFDLKKIRERTRKVGALLVIDGTQSIGALPFSVKEIDPDALICAGYKTLMGPYGMGIAYYGKAFDEGIPVEQNWINRYNSEDFANLVNYEERYREAALRYGVGQQSNFILVPMQIEALKLILKWKPEDIQQYCKGLISPFIDEARNLGCWVEDEHWRVNNLFGVRLPQTADLDKIKNVFAKNRVSVSIRGSAIRISPSVYNDPLDIKKLTKSFQEGLS